MSYAPTPNTMADRALRFIEERLRDQPRGSWVPNTEVCRHLNTPPNAIRPSLEPAVVAGVVERSVNTSGYMQWRLAMPKPRRAAKAAKPAPAFSLPSWPPGFVSQYDSIKVAQYEERRK